MAQPDNTTPESADSERLTPASEPMIIDGRVVDGAPAAEEVHAELVEDSAQSLDGPPVRPRNGKANAGLLLGIAALVLPIAGLAVIVTAVAAVVLSMMGIRRAIYYYGETGVSVGRWPATIGMALGVAATVFSLWTFFAGPATPVG